ncbi:MAG: TatD family hydrolase [Chloroflexi bacterium]|nr:TatD family hydrolase [Chloroflexota bacterium]
MIDTHCHLNFDSYDDDRDAVIARAAAAGVDRIILPAVDITTSREVLALCDRYPGLYAAVGIHPNDTADFTESTLDEIATLVHHPRVVAIGEIGLDYYWNKSPKAQQFAAFEAQLALAARVGLPVIIHNRDASDDVIRILETWASTLPEPLKTRPGVLHSFSGSMAIAERALAAGFYLGFTGPITYKKADETRAIAARVPPDRLLVETDGPFLTPTPYRGKRNEPAYILYIVDRLAALHLMKAEEMARITTENAERLFNFPQ